MEIFQNPAVIWFAIGLILLVAELLMPGLIILFFGVGAWVTALAYLFLDVSLNSQLVIFMTSSIISLALLRRFLVKDKNPSAPFLNNNELNQEFIGHTCTVSETIIPGPVGGRVQFRGTHWKALSDFSLSPGQTARIISKDSIVLKVEPTSIS